MAYVAGTLSEIRIRILWIQVRNFAAVLTLFCSVMRNLRIIINLEIQEWKVGYFSRAFVCKGQNLLPMLRQAVEDASHCVHFAL
jgi:hypothetical protein